MSKNALFSAIDELEKDYIKIWEDVCCIESPTLYKEGIDAVGNYFAQLAKGHGFRIERLPFTGAGDVVVITMNPDAEGAPVCLSGHMDTVHERGVFGTPPVRKDDANIYGPGVTDCKGGLVAALLAMDALNRTGFRARPVMLLLQSDEEMGSRPSDHESIRYICRRAKDAIAFFNLEGGHEGTATLTRKGIITFTFTVTGQAAHSAMCATMGASAIAEAAHKILECERLKDENGITCNCGVISGGTVPNAVAERCVFRADVRYSNAQEREDAIAYMEQVANKAHIEGCSCTLTYSKRGRLAMEYTERNAALLATINRIYENNGMSPLRPIRSNGGSDAADVTEAGIPCLDNFGVFGGWVHSTKEYARLDSLTIAAKRLAIVIHDIV